MGVTKEELKAIFAGKVPTLVAALEDWFEEEVEAIDAGVEAGAPFGQRRVDHGDAAGNRLQARARCDRGHQEECLEIDLPPEIIKPGGYDSCADMIADIVPKLEKVFIGDIKVKKRKPAKVLEPA